VASVTYFGATAKNTHGLADAARAQVDFYEKHDPKARFVRKVFGAGTVDLTRPILSGYQELEAQLGR
jgi:hypothetical protein